MMKIQDRVVTDTKFNQIGLGTGILVGLEVYRGANCEIIEDKEVCNALLSDEEGFGGSYIVQCYDPDGEIKKMFGKDRLAFSQCDNVRPFWEELGNGHDYSLDSIIEGFEYWVPNDEGDTVRVRHIETRIEHDTSFFEMDDFLSEYSDYVQVLVGGKVMCKFEAENHEPVGIEKKFTVDQYEQALRTLLDCYAARIPTPTDSIDAAKEMIHWSVDGANARYRERCLEP